MGRLSPEPKRLSSSTLSIFQAAPYVEVHAPNNSIPMFLRHTWALAANKHRLAEPNVLLPEPFRVEYYPWFQLPEAP